MSVPGYTLDKEVFMDKKLTTLIITTIAIWLSVFCSIAVAQTVYNPDLKINPKNGIVKFNYGTGVFQCTRFSIITTRQNNLNVDIYCQDTRTKSINISICYRNGRCTSSDPSYTGKYNLDTAEFLPVLECEGGCNPSFTRLRISNLPGTRIKPGYPIPDRKDSTYLTKFPDNNRGLEVILTRENGATAIIFRISNQKRYYPNAKDKVIFSSNSNDPNAPRANRSVGGRTSASNDLAVQASN